MRFLLTSRLTLDSPSSDHVSLHCDGVKDIAFRRFGLRVNLIAGIYNFELEEQS
jgi:hypothetical protein